MSNNSKKKTKAKRLGIKSVLLHGEKQLAITAFGKGNDARIAIQTDATGSNLEKRDEERNIIARKIISVGEKRGIDILGTAEGKPLDAIINNPAENCGEDYLQLKETLEEEFFGQKFPMDNVRIQIIHNILDIQKILGLYVNDIIYAVNNLRDVQDIQEQSDILGRATPTNNANINDTIGKMQPYLGFFGNAFEIPLDSRKKPLKISKETSEKIVKLKALEDQLKNPNILPFQRENLRMDIETIKKDVRQQDIKDYTRLAAADEHNKSVIRLLYACRQCTAHFKGENSIFFLEADKLKKSLKEKFNKADWNILETAYTKRTEDINRTFLDHSKVNLRILFGLFKDTEQDEIIKEYFRFSILKEGKNLGVNMKHLREVMLYGKRIEENGVIRYEGGHQPEIKDPKHDSYRSKIYAVTDYILFREFVKSTELEKMVSTLRETTDETVKETLYQQFADTAWEKSQQYILPFYQRFASGSYPAFDSTPLNTQLDKSLQRITVSDISFVQILAFLCNFLDGKEINELLSAYINKFENIQSFIDTLKGLGEMVKFEPAYEIFNGKTAGQIAQQLRFLVSIAKMKDDMSGAKRELYKAAIKTLGCRDEFVKDNETFNKWIDDYVMKKDTRNADHPLAFRRFIDNNVIASNRFMYLIRYTKPETVCTLMRNKTIVRYVLSRIALAGKSHDPNSIHSEQIDKYYKNLGLTENVDLQGKIDALTHKLAGLSFNTFVNSKDKIIDASRNPGRKNVEIQQLKGLVGLYLTVAFIAVKNLVKANARYYIAFAAFERDIALYREKLKDDTEALAIFTNEQGRTNYFALTEHFLNRDDQVRYVPNTNISDAENKKELFKFIDTRAGKWHFTKKWNTILRQNIDEAKAVQSTGGLLVEVRNNAEHLNVLTKLDKYVTEFAPTKMTSYFQLYHFVLQKILCEDKDLQLGNLPEKLKQYHSPCEDFIKIAYVSLAYNLARYKNLTCEALFDEDSDTGKELQKKWEAKRK